MRGGGSSCNRESEGVAKKRPAEEGRKPERAELREGTDDVSGGPSESRVIPAAPRRSLLKPKPGTFVRGERARTTEERREGDDPLLLLDFVVV
jgi:hypothetical protein